MCSAKYRLPCCSCGHAWLDCKKVMNSEGLCLRTQLVSLGWASLCLRSKWVRFFEALRLNLVFGMNLYYSINFQLWVNFVRLGQVYRCKRNWHVNFERSIDAQLKRNSYVAEINLDERTSKLWCLCVLWLDHHTSQYVRAMQGALGSWHIPKESTYLPANLIRRTDLAAHDPVPKM